MPNLGQVRRDNGVEMNNEPHCFGRLVPQLLAFETKNPGEYAIPPDLSDHRNGIYTVQVEQGNNRASARFTVMR
jgi:hypothetical protein